MKRLQDKVAIITGGGRGIGRAIALGFSQEGAHVVIASRSESELEDVATEIIQTGQSVIPIVCDVTDEDQVKTLVAETLDTFSQVDILVNNAGTGAMRPVWGTPKGTFESILAVNLIGTFLCTKHVWRPMRDAAGGSIINVSSMGGLEGYPLLSAYCASKFGQIGFTKACAEEGKQDNIRVNAIAPGKADTAFRAQIKENKSQMLKADDHVGICIFLASNESQYINGQVIPIEWYGPEVMRE
ncbi:MAG TPA: SDR family oxidoreductase [Anaerolineae bacterium]|nr:SDR family oxidoreductase [Anaerolineae bacterium]